MAHFAELDENNKVINVIVIHNNELLDENGKESEAKGIEFCHSLFGSNKLWVQTSYNGNFRKRYAGIGFTYNENLDAFISPQPYPSWLLNNTTADWEAPVTLPADAISPENPEGNMYIWNESIVNWEVYVPPESNT